MAEILSGGTASTFVKAATAALLIYAPVFEPTLLPSKNYLPEQKSDAREISWNPWPQNPYYDNAKNYSSEDLKNLMIIQEFASTLVANLQELDPEISRKVNEDFWNLV